MQKYPDKIAIYEVKNGGNPFESKDFTLVYGGKCRCYLSRQSAFRKKIMDCDYGAVIPDRTMIDIGENFKVAIKFHNSKSNNQWDIVGYVKDFARYDRVCNIYFQMVKENIIAEDIPSGDNVPKDWPILKGIDMQYVSFYHMEMDELPYWAYYGDWSKSTSLESRFEGCSNLKEANVSTATNATSFNKTFKDCESLEKVIMPELFTNIDDFTRTFEGCKSLIEMFIPKSATRRFAGTFATSQDTDEGCTSLKKVIFEDMSDYDDNGQRTGTFCAWVQAFNGCTALEEVIVEGYIGSSAYNDFNNTGLADCPLTQECLSALIDALLPDPPHVLVMAAENDQQIDIRTDVFNIGPDNIAKLSPRDLEIAEQKGWTLT